MPKSDWRNLQAYHQQILDKERKTMSTSTSFDTEKLDDEALAAANARVAAINRKQPQPYTQTTVIQPPPEAPVPPPKEADPEPKRERMTVGKLAERYQKRIAENTENIAKMESIVVSYQQKIAEHKASLAVWQEALAEIKAD